MVTLLLVGCAIYLAGMPIGLLIGYAYSHEDPSGFPPSWRTLAWSAIAWPAYFIRCR